MVNTTILTYLRLAFIDFFLLEVWFPQRLAYFVIPNLALCEGGGGIERYCGLGGAASTDMVDFRVLGREAMVLLARA